MEKIIIISEYNPECTQFELSKLYNGDKITEEEAIQKYMEEYDVDDRSHIQARTLSLCDIK